MFDETLANISTHNCTRSYIFQKRDSFEACNDSKLHNQDIKLCHSTVLALDDANPLIGLNSLHGKFYGKI